MARKLGVDESSGEEMPAQQGDNLREEEARKKPMTVEEAAIELNHSEYPFVVFRNSESGDVINVLYRRKDGTLGLIRG